MKRAKLCRLALAGGGLAAAVGAVVFLALPDERAAPSKRARAALPTPWAAPVELAPGERSAELPVYGVPRAAPRTDARVAPPGTAESALAALAKARGQGERLETLRELSLRLSHEEKVATLGGLLRSELPGTPYERETMRLYLIARLGEVPGPRAQEILVARLDRECPRPERLMALEALVGRTDSARVDIEGIAREDHDTVVQDKARWALARAR